MNGLALLAAQAQAASEKDSKPVHSEDFQPRRSAVLSQTARRGSHHKPGQRPYGRGISVHVQVHGQHEAGMPWDAQRKDDERQKHVEDVQRPRPRPIPLPPPSSSRFAGSFQADGAGHGGAGTTGGPDPLPALESMAPLSSFATPGTVDRSRSAKRRKVDHTALVSSNMTRAGVITNKSPQSTRAQHKASPFSPVRVKNEPESPPLERKAFPFLDNGLKMDPDRELKAKGFQVGKYVVRGDDISIEWPSLALPFNGSTATSTPPVSRSRESASPQKTPILAASRHKPAPQLAYNIPITPVPTTSASPKLPPPAPLPALASPSQGTPSSSSSSNASPTKRKRKPKTEHVPCGELDLATAIRLSQRDNASPRPPPFRVSSSSRRSSGTRSPAGGGGGAGGSGAVKPLSSSSSSSSPSLSKLAITHDSQTKAPRTVPSSGLARETRFAEDEVEIVHVYSGEGEEEGEGTDGAPAALGVGQASGWTVIQNIADPDRSDGAEEGVEEEHDQLVEDEVDELREEMEAAEAISMGIKDESGDERDEVENAAILNRPVTSPTVTERVSSEVVPAKTCELMADTVWHDLSRDFLTKYMMVYETDRARLISAYAPDAKLIYRVSEPPPSGAKTSRFPLRSARGHDGISTFLHGLGWTHFTQKLDEDRDKEVDVEFRSERLDQGVWLYVRSVMTMGDAQDPSGSQWANRRSVDHSFLLCKGASENAMEPDAWPLIARVHQLVMHESTL